MHIVRAVEVLSSVAKCMYQTLWEGPAIFFLVLEWNMQHFGVLGGPPLPVNSCLCRSISTYESMIVPVPRLLYGSMAKRKNLKKRRPMYIFSKNACTCTVVSRQLSCKMQRCISHSGWGSTGRVVSAQLCCLKYQVCSHFNLGYYLHMLFAVKVRTSPVNKTSVIFHVYSLKICFPQNNI